MPKVNVTDKELTAITMILDSVKEYEGHNSETSYAEDVRKVERFVNKVYKAKRKKK